MTQIKLEMEEETLQIMPQGSKVAPAGGHGARKGEVISSRLA